MTASSLTILALTKPSMTPSIPSRANLALVSEALAKSIELAADAARLEGVVSLVPLSASELFAHAVAKAVGAVEKRGDLLRRFILLGPYEGDGPVPEELAGKRISDDESERAITLLYSHAVNCFKGELAEVLAIRACTQLLRELKVIGELSDGAMLVAGDAAKPVLGNRMPKGADYHILREVADRVVLDGVAEVKSFVTSPARLARQLVSHTSRASRGLAYKRRDGALTTCIPAIRDDGVLQIAVSLSDWRLSRGYRFVEDDGRTFLHSDPTQSIPDNRVTRVDGNTWHVVLGWSHEALCAEAYGLTYWYMEQLGVDLFAAGSPWPEMTPEEAGANAATQSLYHAIRRSGSRSTEQRAIALYNAYGFGYALGTSYKDRSGRRHMLWAQDLREMLTNDPSDRDVRLR